jgi:hypothetical protein
MHDGGIGTTDREETVVGANTRTESPVACTLSATDLATQGERWRRLRAAEQTARIETDDGLRLVFRRSAGAEAELVALVSIERECCAWARWGVAGDGDALVLEVSSSGDGIPVLHGMFAGRP